MVKIVAPNYTQIPNVIFDYWMEKLSPAQFKVLLCICRKTFGFHKDKDRISIRQIEKMTGVSRKGIIDALKLLEQHDLIIKHQSKSEWGDPEPNVYEIKVYEFEKEIENGGGSVLSTLQGSVLSTPLTTKENITKENNLSNDKLSSASQGSATKFSCRKKRKKKEVAPSVLLTDEQILKLKATYGEEKYTRMLAKYSKWKVESGKHRKSDYQAILAWVVDAVHNDEVDQKNKKKWIDYNLKGVKEIYAHICACGKRGDLKWNVEADKIYDDLLNRSVKLSQQNAMSIVAGWYNETWKYDESL